MPFRLGMHRHRERKEERESKKLAKKDTKKVVSRPPAVPGSRMKSVEQRHSMASSVNSDASKHRSVLFRDNKLPDGTTMPRIQPSPSAMAEREAGRRTSPAGSVRSSISLPMAYSGLASYPASYVPAAGTQMLQGAPLGRQRIHSVVAYEEPMPKPDYPLSNDGTGNSNRDSGLDTLSRSSSSGYRRGFTVTRNGDARHHCASPIETSNNYNQPRNRFVAMSANAPQIIRPRGFQSVDRQPLAPRFQKAVSLNTLNTYGMGGQTGPTRWNIAEDEGAGYHSLSRQMTRRPHCSSCSCCDDPPTMTEMSTSTLRRVQLEDKPVERRNPYTAAPAKPIQDFDDGRRGRRFRRESDDDRRAEKEEEEEEDEPSIQHSWQTRGRFFSESAERYERPAVMRKPLAAKVSQLQVDGKRSNSDYLEDSPPFVRKPREFCRPTGTPQTRSTIRL